MNKRTFIIAVILVSVGLVGYGLGVYGQDTPSSSRKKLKLKTAEQIFLDEKAVVHSTAQAGDYTFAQLFPQGRRIRAGRSEFSPVINVGGASRLVIRIEAAADNPATLGYLIRFGPMPDNSLKLFNDDQTGTVAPGAGVDVALPVRAPMMQVELLNLGASDLSLGSGATVYATP